ncbi:MAG: hypothetical protein KGP28_11680 [Bdellovibrionales bacterium]|nr:hypothetical protein [Bdellovibrionales bacterium]
MNQSKSQSSPLFQIILSAFILSSCQYNPLSSEPAPLPSLPAPPKPSPSKPSESSPSFQTCKSSDQEFQCLALKIVSYEDSGTPSVLGKIQAETLTNEINKVWSQCKIGFQIERYESVNPLTLGLQYNPEWRSQAGKVRSTFSDNNSLLVVATGKLTSSTIAVTQMPGYGPFGVLVEDSFANNPLTVGHELGHYMGLYHFRNSSNLMNPYIGTYTENLTPSQCQIARATNQREWVQMMR